VSLKGARLSLPILTNINRRNGEVRESGLVVDLRATWTDEAGQTQVKDFGFSSEEVTWNVTHLISPKLNTKVKATDKKQEKGGRIGDIHSSFGRIR
jgi:hypothetical protein